VNEASQERRTPIMHTIPAKSNHNTDKNLIQRHVKPETMRKLPRVILT